MAIQVTAKSLDEIPEVMREFVTENDGVFSYDAEKAFAALKTERENAKNARNALAPFKALNLSPEQIKAFADLGRTPAELAELIAKAASPAPKTDVRQSTEYLELKKELETLSGFKKKWEEAEARNRENKRNDLVRAAVRALPDEYDKELFAGLVESALLGKFSLNESGDGLNPVDGMLPDEFLKKYADTYHFKKPSKAGNAAPGNADLKKSGNAAYEAAKKAGDINGMFANLPATN